MKTTKRFAARNIYSLTLMAAFLLPGVHAANAGYADVILADGPAAYYRLNETAGATTAVDSGPNHFNATYVYSGGYPLLGVPGIAATAAGFDGQGGANGGLDYVDIPYQPALAGSVFSSECWAQANGQAASYSVVLAMFGSYIDAGTPNASGWNFYQSPGPNSYWLLNAKPAPGFVQNDSVLITPGQWYHLAATCDGSFVTFYVNGVVMDSQAASGFIPESGYPGQIGAGVRVGWYPFNGQVCEVAFYQSALLATQILAHYQAGAGSPPTVGPVSIALSGGDSVAISWPTGTLQSATNVIGPYSPVPGATSPYTTSADPGVSVFFRASVP